MEGEAGRKQRMQQFEQWREEGCRVRRQYQQKHQQVLQRRGWHGSGHCPEPQQSFLSEQKMNERGGGGTPALAEVARHLGGPRCWPRAPAGVPVLANICAVCPLPLAPFLGRPPAYLRGGLLSAQPWGMQPGLAHVRAFSRCLLLNPVSASPAVSAPCCNPEHGQQSTSSAWALAGWQAES